MSEVAEKAETFVKKTAIERTTFRFLSPKTCEKKFLGERFMLLLNKAADRKQLLMAVEDRGKH
jgi:hypothetical protein